MQNSSLNKDPKNIQSMFASIADSYDKANKVMTFGLDKKWRKQVVKYSKAQKQDKILDCATGTGDLAFCFENTIGANTTGIDFCQEMINIAKQKAVKQNSNTEFKTADMTQLPFKDNQFNVCSVAYGIRNTNNIKLALKEMARVTKPDGYLVILETGVSSTFIIKQSLSFYTKHIMPLLGGFISGKKTAYQYLNQSSQNFPGGKNFVKLLKDTGHFKNIEFKSLCLGASFLYRAQIK
ncbi:MAG: bifunctional demethylmenaquinone methyltransferase/2-methoxy-6-polyprenyl-1,4-benzoquinol methylase UbiE [Bdellovibrionales bacterium]|nr:bifunctional demethylmenaquinone methyltransferase/2-methoxy-6-polyprenyl-1,4-benzoquinol methylase UbiE [Bdellovibrionales bacterium]